MAKLSRTFKLLLLICVLNGNGDDDKGEPNLFGDKDELCLEWCSFLLDDEDEAKTVLDAEFNFD